MSIGGNTTLLLQTKKPDKSAISEDITTYTDYKSLKGWLDLQSGDSRYATYNAKIEESTHVFIGDYSAIDKDATELSATVGGRRYDVKYIDDPQERHRQLEIYLKYVGV